MCERGDGKVYDDGIGGKEMGKCTCMYTRSSLENLRREEGEHKIPYFKSFLGGEGGGGATIFTCGRVLNTCAFFLLCSLLSLVVAHYARDCKCLSLSASQ